MNMKLHTLRWSSVVCLAMLNACGDGDGGTAPEVPGTLQFTATSYDATEGTTVNIVVARSGGRDGIASVDYATADGDAGATTGD